MPFQSSKITPKTLLHFPGRVSTAPSAAEPLLPVLIVLHQETSSPGRVGNALRALGHANARHAARRAGGASPGRPCADWILSDPAHRRRAQDLPGLAGSRLPLAPRGI